MQQVVQLQFGDSSLDASYQAPDHKTAKKCVIQVSGGALCNVHVHVHVRKKNACCGNCDTHVHVHVHVCAFLDCIVHSLE